MKELRRIVGLGLCLLLLTFQAYGQRNKKGTPPAVENGQTTTAGNSKDEAFATHKSIYDQAILFNDLNVATNAIYAMLQIKPERKGLRDTLARIYFQRAAWSQCILVTSQALAENPKDEQMLELRAISRQSIGMAKEALTDYNALFNLGGNPHHLYEIATLEYAMRRFGECEVTINRLLQHEGIKDKKMIIGAGKNQKQEVPMAAAVLNLRGVIDLEQGKKPSAAEYFQASLKIFPAFELAKNNLELTKQ